MITMASIVKLRVRRGFYDREANRYRPSSEVFEVSERRARVIVAAGVAEVMEVVAAPDAAETPTSGDPQDADPEGSPGETLETETDETPDGAPEEAPEEASGADGEEAMEQAGLDDDARKGAPKQRRGGRRKGDA